MNSARKEIQRKELLIAEWIEDVLDAQTSPDLNADQKTIDQFSAQAAIDGLLRGYYVPRAVHDALPLAVMARISPDATATSTRRRRQDATVRSIFQRIARQDQRARRRMTRRWLAVAALLFAMIGAAAWIVTQPSNPVDLPRILYAEDAVRLAGSPVVVGAALPVNVALSTNNGSAVITWTDGTRIALSAQTELRVVRVPRGRRLALRTGTIQVSAAPQPADAPLVIATAQSLSTVVGTRFTVIASTTATRLEVSAGRVRFSALDGSAAVIASAGQRMRMSADQHLLALPMPLLEADVEDGRLPSGFSVGLVAVPPSGNTSRFCLKTEHTVWTEKTQQVAVGNYDTGLFDFDPDLVLSFDYWAMPDQPWLSIWMGNLSDGSANDYTFTQISSKQWVHMEVPLRDFHVASGNSGRVSERGERIAMFGFQTSADSNSFFIDNIRLAKPDPVDSSIRP